MSESALPENADKIAQSLELVPLYQEILKIETGESCDYPFPREEPMHVTLVLPVWYKYRLRYAVTMKHTYHKLEFIET